jgi:hypothetical protein
MWSAARGDAWCVRDAGCARCGSARAEKLLLQLFDGFPPNIDYTSLPHSMSVMRGH